MPIKGDLIPICERFWKFVNKKSNSECWLWSGAKNKKGYGMIGSAGRGRPLLAHRVSWEIHNGSISHGLEINHKCFTVGCVNPLHLEECSHLNNVRHSSRSLRMGKLKDKIIIVKQMIANGSTAREISNKFGIAFCTARRIMRGETHKVL